MRRAVGSEGICRCYLAGCERGEGSFRCARAIVGRSRSGPRTSSGWGRSGRKGRMWSGGRGCNTWSARIGHDECVSSIKFCWCSNVPRAPTIVNSGRQLLKLLQGNCSPSNGGSWKRFNVFGVREYGKCQAFAATAKRPCSICGAPLSCYLT